MLNGPSCGVAPGGTVELAVDPDPDMRLWAALAFCRRGARPLDRAEVAVVLQVVLGVWLLAGEGIPVPDFHVFYGFVAVIAVSIIFSYRSQLREHLYMLYGLGGLFVMGLGIRTMTLTS